MRRRRGRRRRRRDAVAAAPGARSARGVSRRGRAADPRSHRPGSMRRARLRRLRCRAVSPRTVCFAASSRRGPRARASICGWSRSLQRRQRRDDRQRRTARASSRGRATTLAASTPRAGSRWKPMIRRERRWPLSVPPVGALDLSPRDAVGHGCAGAARRHRLDHARPARDSSARPSPSSWATRSCSGRACSRSGGPPASPRSRSTPRHSPTARCSTSRRGACASTPCSPAGRVRAPSRSASWSRVGRERELFLNLAVVRDKHLLLEALGERLGRWAGLERDGDAGRDG